MSRVPSQRGHVVDALADEHHMSANRPHALGPGVAAVGWLDIRSPLEIH
ncbi:hypothetical protein [Nocardioides sp. InS609-2]|nr:hypothetical protein [Nocardioides sp. InS609-2]